MREIKQGTRRDISRAGRNRLRPLEIAPPCYGKLIGGVWPGEKNVKSAKTHFWRETLGSRGREPRTPILAEKKTTTPTVRQRDVRTKRKGKEVTSRKARADSRGNDRNKISVSFSLGPALGCKGQTGSKGGREGVDTSGAATSTFLGEWLKSRETSTKHRSEAANSVDAGLLDLSGP